MRQGFIREQSPAPSIERQCCARLFAATILIQPASQPRSILFVLMFHARNYRTG